MERDSFVLKKENTVQGVSYGTTLLFPWNSLNAGIYGNSLNEVVEQYEEEHGRHREYEESLLPPPPESMVSIKLREFNEAVVYYRVASRSLLVLGLVFAMTLGYAGVSYAPGVYSNFNKEANAVISETYAAVNAISESIVGPAEPVVFDGLTAAVTNEYSGKGYKMFPYPFLKDALLMEPYRESTVTINGWPASCSLDYSLVFDNDPDNINIKQSVADSNGVFVVSPTVTGKYTFTVQGTCPESPRLTQTVWVKYVRRELQSLTDQDREEFLDAYRTLWDLPTKQGVAKYGKKYKSVNYFAMIHNDGGANPVCDEFHAGTGFLSNHIYLGAYLEQSMRLINPRVSLHYMDYSKYFDSADFNQHIKDPMDGGSWTEIFSDKWFGKNDPYSGIIVDSRWANTKVPYVDSNFLSQELISDKTTFFPAEEKQWLAKHGPHIASPYGLLRAPWNYNPSEYTTRYNNVNRIPTADIPEHVMKPYLGSNCEDMKIFFAEYTVGQPLQLYLESTEDNIHGYVHFTLGGSGGDRAAEIDEILRSKYGLTDIHLFYIAESTHKFVKSYLSGIAVNYINPLNCTGTPWKDGKLLTTAKPGEPGGPLCTCNSYYFESEERLDQLLLMYFNHFMPDDDSIKNLDFDTRKEIMELACQRMSYEGDLAGSGAATDPIFWVAHGSVDRLFQRVVFENVLSDMVYKSSRRGATCSGHEATGTKRWLKGLYFEDENIDASELTNEELIEILNPTTDAYRDLIDTLYDDSTWPWCDGFDKWLTATPSEEQATVA
jgi:hypothetical protein